MDEIEKQLDEGRFWRIHKSYIVNVSYVSEFGAREVCLRNGERLPVSRTFRESVQEKLLGERMGRSKWEPLTPYSI
jgi:DNA-binding LytR/AlgR family response regulator